MRWKAGLALGLVLAAGVLLVGAGGSTGSAVEARHWEKLPRPAAQPARVPDGLLDREEVVLVVVAATRLPDDPSAQCAAPTEPRCADEGRSYDIDSGHWRPIADAPIGFSWAQTSVLGSTAYVWIAVSHSGRGAPSAFLAYRIEEDRWDG